MIQWLLSKRLKSTESIKPRASYGVRGLALLLDSLGEIMLKTTYINAEDGICATVTEVTKGFAVTLIDADSESIVATRVYENVDQARVWALEFIKGVKHEDER